MTKNIFNLSLSSLQRKFIDDNILNLNLNSGQGKCTCSSITPPYILLEQESEFNLKQVSHYIKFNLFRSFSNCALPNGFVSKSATFSSDAIF